MNQELYFKGWAKPGPVIPSLGDDSELNPSPTETLDALSGHFRIFQLKKGHRFSTDDLLTAWYGTSWCPSPRTILDLGSGIGSVGMTAAWRVPGSQVVTIEAQEVSVGLARRSCRYNGLQDRYEIRLGDFRDSSVLDKTEKFDLILGTPPYFPVGAGILGDHPQKIACRFEMRGSIDDYCRIASEHLTWGGIFACIFPINSECQAARVRSAAKTANLSMIRSRPVILKEGEAPLLSLFALMRSDHLPESFREKTWKEPPLVIRRDNGEIHPEYAAVKLSFGLPPL